MTRQVQVRRILDDEYAEVILERGTACSGDCHKCAGGCTAAREMLVVRAKNPVHARPGDTVLLEMSGKQMLKIAVVVYLTPIALFFLGWGLGSLFGAAPVLGALGFLAGVGVILWYNRRVERKNAVQYRIVGFL